MKEIGVKNGQGREVNIVYFLKSGETRLIQNPAGHNQEMPCYLQPKLHEKLIDYIFLESKKLPETFLLGHVISL